MEERYGRLVVVGWDGAKASCVCDCGTVVSQKRGALVAGHARSCGCLQKNFKNLKQNTKHGMSNTLEYKAWNNMRVRCNNTKISSFHRYGGRGIKVCQRWDRFENFLSDMGYAPPNTSLDRIDNNKGYGPNNCKWSSRQQQMRNVSTNHKITFNGETLTLTEWAQRTGIPAHALSSRLNKKKLGWSVERALITALRPTRRNNQASSIARGALFDRQTDKGKRPAINPLRNKRQPFAASRNSKGRAAKSSQAPKP